MLIVFVTSSIVLISPVQHQYCLECLVCREQWQPHRCHLCLDFFRQIMLLTGILLMCRRKSSKKELKELLWGT